MWINSSLLEVCQQNASERMFVNKLFACCPEKRLGCSHQRHAHNRHTYVVLLQMPLTYCVRSLRAICLRQLSSCNSFEQARQRHTISDGDVALEKGAVVLHIVLTAFPRLSDTRLADSLVLQCLATCSPVCTASTINWLRYNVQAYRMRRYRA